MENNQCRRFFHINANNLHLILVTRGPGIAPYHFTMARWQTMFEGQVAYDPGAGLEPTLQSVPARWAVYLVVDADDTPVQLLCVKNPRASLRRRLGDPEAAAPEASVALSKRADLRDIVRRIYYRRVDSAFEADLAYLQAARAIFPSRYRDIVGYRPAWFLHVDADESFPRYVRTAEFSSPAGTYLGPIQEKGEAAKLIETVQDLFDLCRYHHLLTASPHAPACAYKEMGKCPAPCDGSIPMQQYRQLIAWSLATLMDPAHEIAGQEARMRAAASEMKYETAGKIKAFVTNLAGLRKTAYRFLRPLEDFRYLAVQPGPREATAKLFACTPNGVTPLFSISGKATGVSREAAAGLRTAAFAPDDALSPEDRVGLVTAHLFKPKDGSVFFHASELSDRALDRAVLAVSKSAALTPASDEDGDEGILRELRTT